VEYLTRWRMLLVGDKLTHSGDLNTVIARSRGYGIRSHFQHSLQEGHELLTKAIHPWPDHGPPSQSECKVARAQLLSAIAG
jgi:hypothetical protein